MDYTIAQYPKDMAAAAVHLAFGYIKAFKGTEWFCDYKNGNPFADNFWTGFAIIDKNNVDQFL
jgi:ABC-type sugar transport system substrate-binding protein